MKMYHYSEITGEYFSEANAPEDPREPGNYHLPAHATFIEPPEAPDGMVAVFGGETWTIKPDQRGAEYWLADGTHVSITNIGDTVPEDALPEPPDLRTPEEKRRLAFWEMESRITKQASLVTQMQITATINALSPNEQDTWKQWLNWVADMRATAKRLSAAFDDTHTEDRHWPILPPDVVTFLESYQ